MLSKPLPAGLKLADEIIDLAGQVDAISKSQAIASFGLDGVILSANQNFLDLFGYTMAEIAGRHHSIFVEPAQAETAAYLQFWSILQNGHFQAAEFKRIGKDGREIWLQASYNPILGFDGRPSKVMKFATDVTERKQNEALLAGQVNAIAKSQAVIEFALDGTVLAANRNYLDILGYDLGEILGRHHGLFVDPAYRESAAYRQFWDNLRDGAYHAAEFKRVGKHGREVWLQATYNPILDLSDTPRKVVKFATDITARKRAETRVVALEAKFLAIRDAPDAAKLRLFESIVIHANDAVLITEAEPNDLPGPCIVYANQAFMAMTGYSAEDIIGQTPRMFQGPLTGTEAPAKIKAALIAWQPVQIEILNYHKDGTAFWVELSISPLCDENGRYTHWISVQRDITRRKRAQETLRKSENFLARTAALAGIGGWEIELATGELFFSDETYRIYGLEAGAELSVDTAISFFAPEARETLIAAIASCSRDGVPYDIEIPFIRANGERIWARAIGSAELADGKPFRISGLFQDIDKQVKERLALQQAHDTLHLAKEAGRIGIWTWDLATNEVDCDSTIYHLYGVTKSDSASFFDKWLTCLHEQDRDRVAQAMQEAAAGKADYNTQFRIIQPGGALRHIRSSGIVSRDPAGAALRMTGALWDVTVEETENLALKTATERMRLAADSGEIGILEFDFLSSQLFPDEWSCRILGIAQPPGQAIPADVFSLIVHPDDRERRDKARQDALDGIAPFALDYRILRNDGATRHLKCSATITRDAAGRALRMTGSIQDITARKEIEEALALKAVELAEIALELKRSNGELSQFAAMASHDLQEPLRMVSSYTQLLGKRYKGKLDADADEFIAFAVDGCNRMKQLIKDLLTYSKVGTNGLDLRATSSEEALAGALWNLQGAIQDSGALVTHDAMPAVLADASQLTQLFQNLVGNGIKYRGGEVPRIHISATASAAGRWRFEVRDNGLGIDAEHFERIFGMFQRLHGAGEYSGTGIGLAICKKIVDRHGGVIWVDSKPGAGSGFHFTLAEASSG